MTADFAPYQCAFTAVELRGEAGHCLVRAVRDQVSMPRVRKLLIDL